MGGSSSFAKSFAMLLLALPPELLVAIAVRLGTYAAVAAGFERACRTTLRAGRAARASFLSRVAADGTVLEPDAGFFFRVSAPRWLTILRRCPADATLLLEEGIYNGPSPLHVTEGVHLFGHGHAVVDSLTFVLDAPSVTMDGIQFGYGRIVVTSGTARLQSVHFNDVPDSDENVIVLGGACRLDRCRLYTCYYPCDVFLPVLVATNSLASVTVTRCDLYGDLDVREDELASLRANTFFVPRGRDVHATVLAHNRIVWVEPHEL